MDAVPSGSSSSSRKSSDKSPPPQSSLEPNPLGLMGMTAVFWDHDTFSEPAFAPLLRDDLPNGLSIDWWQTVLEKVERLQHPRKQHMSGGENPYAILFYSYLEVFDAAHMNSILSVEAMPAKYVAGQCTLDSQGVERQTTCDSRKSTSSKRLGE